MEKKSLLSIQLNTGSYSKFLETVVEQAKRQTSRYVCVSNVHMLVEAYLHPSFAKIVNNADMATPDGMPLTWGLRLLQGIKQDRVAGMDLLPDLLNQCSIEGLPVYFYGGTETMLDKTGVFVKENYPALRIAGMYSPPFRKLTKAEDEEIVDKINNSGARIVFVVLGCPKQEKWMAQMKGRVNAVMIGIGGALPVLVGMQKRAPMWMQKTGMEWAFRLVQDPKRLAKRYLITNSIFIYLLFLQKLKITFAPAKHLPVVNMNSDDRVLRKSA